MSGRVGPLKPSFINTYSLDFDGVDDYVFIENGIFDATNGLTLSFWVKYDGVGAGNNWLFSNGGTGGVNSQFNTRLASNGLWFNYLVGGSFYTGIAGLNDGNWHHLTQVIDYQNSIMHFYKDGIKSTATRTSTYSQVTWGTISTPFFPFKGQVDEVTLIGRVLTQSEITSISSKPTDLTPLNPIAWYRMGDNGSYKSPQWLLPNNENKDKVSNYSLDFDGVDDYIDCGNISELNGVTEASWSIWAAKNGTSDYYLMSCYSTTGSLQQYLFQQYSDKLYVYLSNSGGTLRLMNRINFTFNIDEWYHIGIVYNEAEVSNADKVKVYINGTLQTNQTTGFALTSLRSTTASTNIGRAVDFTTKEYNGKIDEVAIFDSAISIGDVWDGSGQPIDVSAVSGIVSYYKMGEEATFVYDVNPDGTWTIPDQVGSNDGTSNNQMADSARVGSAPSSSNNAVSFNMDLIDRVEDTP